MLSGNIFINIMKCKNQSIFTFQTIKSLLIDTLSKEIHYEKSRMKLFEKVFPVAKKLNFIVNVTSQNNKISLTKNNIEVKTLARSPFKITKPSAFDDESPDTPLANDESIIQVSLKKSPNTIIFDIFSDSSKIYIKNVVIKDEKNLYVGRHFSSLHPDTQEYFSQYLNSRVPISEISNFIDKYGIERNDELYVHWLKNIQKCLK